MTTMTDHPSNVLYRGEAKDFRDAMRLVMAECDMEMRLTRIHARDYPEFGSEAQEQGLYTSLEEYKTTARAALRIYERHVRAAEEAAIAEMRAAGEDLAMFAEALESGDYSTLAI